ncbi:hypothetical protein KR009_003934, partial [Drosophila setifemur]
NYQLQFVSRGRVEKVMSSLRRLIRQFLGIFFALNGVLDFYLDRKSGKPHRSRILTLYRMVHNFMVLLLTTKFLLDFSEVNCKDIMESTLMTLNFLAYFTLVYLSVLSCMDCSYRWQDRIYKMLWKLHKQQEMAKSRGYTVPRRKQRFLDRRLALLVVLLIIRVGVHLALNLLRDRMGFFHPCNCFLPELMIFAMNSFVFSIVAKICRCCWRVESGLEMVLRNPKPIQDKLNEIRSLKNMLQAIVDLTSEVCAIFKSVLLFYLARVLWSGIVVGYLLIRMFWGRGKGDPVLMYVVLAFVICVQPLMYAAVMHFLTHEADSLLEDVKEIIRQPQKQSAKVERSLEWFSLHLATQHTDITIFGTFRINRSLAFQSVSLILIHVLYMVQSDYIVLFK